MLSCLESVQFAIGCYSSIYDEVKSAEGKTGAHDLIDDVQSDYGKGELLSQLNPADGHAETMIALLACMNIAGDCFAPAAC